MEIILRNIEKLDYLKSVIKMLNRDEYMDKSILIGNASIGQHIRHVLEMYTSLLNQYEDNYVNYDDRKRDLRTETEIEYATGIIDQIIISLNKTDKPLSMLAPSITGNHEAIKTNYYRELLYTLEHTVHHEALIRIAIEQINKYTLNPEFGVASSTLKHRQHVQVH